MVSDEKATQQMLQNILPSKQAGEDPLLMSGFGAGHRPQRHQNNKLDSANDAAYNVEMEIEKAAYVRELCSASTRKDTKEWIGKIFEMQYEDKIQEARREAAERRRRRMRISA